jgi:hypothetical protein
VTRAGQLRDSVTLQRRGLDANGDRLSDTWGDDVVRDARIVYQRRGEAVLEARLQGVQPAWITVRLDGDPLVAQVTTGWRAVSRDGHVFDIKSVAPDEDGVFVVFTAEDNGTDGGA